MTNYISETLVYSFTLDDGNGLPGFMTPSSIGGNTGPVADIDFSSSNNAHCLPDYEFVVQPYVHVWDGIIDTGIER